MRTVVPHQSPGVFPRPDGARLEQHDGETIRQHKLNKSAMLVWRLIDGRASQLEVAERLAEAYPASRESIAKDVGRLLASLETLGLIELATATDLSSTPRQRPAPAFHESVYFFHPKADTYWLHSAESRVAGGAQTSTIQVAGCLRAAGYECALVNCIEKPGIYLVHPDSYRPEVFDRPDVFLVSIRNDRAPNPDAHCEIVQNPNGVSTDEQRPAFFVPYYPQRGLVPRDHRRRRDTFRTIAYDGRCHNLAPELLDESFQNWMGEHGLELVTRFSPQQWGDYAEVDAVIAIRDFQNPWHQKPANKLVNAWLAEVPALLGPESAFRFYRRSDLDYFEINSPARLREVLLELKSNSDLVHRMRANARARQEEVGFESVTRCWIDTLDRCIKPLARAWFSR